MNNGWIKLHRSIRGHWLYEDSNYLRAWVIMLSVVNYEPKKVLIHNHLYDCDRGQSLFSLNTWVETFGTNKKAGSWSIQKVRTFFRILETDGMIQLEDVRKTTRLTIANYNTYQDTQHETNTQLTYRQHTANIQLTTTKEVKKEKKENKANISSGDLINSLKTNPLYTHVDIDHEFLKANEWIKDHPNRRFTPKFFKAWINRIEKPIIIEPQKRRML